MAGVACALTVAGKTDDVVIWLKSLQVGAARALFRLLHKQREKKQEMDANMK